MILGIFAKTFPRPTVEEVFDAVAALGLRGVQFNFACAGLPSLPLEIDPSALARIRDAAARRAIAIAAVSGTCNLIHPDLNQRREAWRRLPGVIAGAAALGAPVVTLCTGTRDVRDMWRRHPDNDTAEAWRDLIEALGAILPEAERRGVALGLEPEGGNVISSARTARRLLDEIRSPRLKIVFDAANLAAAEPRRRMDDVWTEALGLLGGELVLAHAKELGAGGHAGDAAIGSGTLDWDLYLRRLREAGFRGPLVLHGFAEADAAASVGFLRDKLRVMPDN